MTSSATVLHDGILYHKLTKELYINHKKDGWTDRRIMGRYGMNNVSLSKWKKENLTKDEITNLSLRKGPAAEVKKEKREFKQAPIQTFDKELKQAIAELKELKKENEDLTSRLTLAKVEDNSELENLKSACSDLENETITLQRQIIEKDYEITNKDYALQSLNIKMQNYQKENAALKELVRLWI
ncbi:hypothetical protein KHA93_11705 [Bacillus sp. FJAT-49732]|uniref:Uncharacterized protein n=1 Tax=Lederbergia citrisecunda TaxID=2833583 RepID=A0A942TP41_9BACI|nr:hypothetical protein [Lederbergia citrisecunda]MBS4200296.1 hypothetical protein [Lederbergia citrisecunda]